VVNLRLAADCFRTPEGRRQVRGLVEGYFAQGGLQLQINVVDQALLRDACEHPERYGDLVVRMGGYSEYWSRLDDELRRTLLQRTEHETG
jgi:formate C-acetyltransferase